MICVPPDLRIVAQGFHPYNGKNPHVLGRQTQTFLDNIHEHKIAWAGTQYSSRINIPIVASARKNVEFIRTFKGYHGLEDDVIIDHGGGGTNSEQQNVDDEIIKKIEYTVDPENPLLIDVDIEDDSEYGFKKLNIYSFEDEEESGFCIIGRNTESRKLNCRLRIFVIINN